MVCMDIEVQCRSSKSRILVAWRRAEVWWVPEHQSVAVRWQIARAEWEIMPVT